MFCCIDVARDQVELQLVLWRFPNQNKSKQLRLLTVSYGTTSAPFLATCCLKLIADYICESDGKTAKWIDLEFYMGDFLCGADDAIKAAALQQKVQYTLALAHFNLRKWAASNDAALESVAPADRENGPCCLDKDPDHVVGTLGIHWCPAADKLSFKAWLGESVSCTKRSLLSEVMRIFDPLGLLGPVTICFCLLFQRV